MIDTKPINTAIKHATTLRDKFRKVKNWEDYKFWKQEVYRLQSDLLRADRINKAHTTDEE